MLGSLLQNRYQVVEELGRGGMGVVYRAHDNLLERDVALKVLSPQSSESGAAARLLHEAQAIARLDHPNIVAVYDAGEADHQSYVVMQLVAGRSLVERPPESITETLHILQQVCAALDHAHAHGIIHRDLKPENIMVTEDGVAKLMDFGMARSAVSRLSIDGMVIGTVFYMAPEQALGHAIDKRADLYSLGVMLFELSAGRLPFLGDDPLAIISQHIHAPVVPPSTYNPQVSSEIDNLVLGLMAKQPEDRPASAGEVSQRIEKILNGKPSADTAQKDEISLINRITRGRLVGRESEFKEASAIWQKAALGEGGTLLISGEPGIGKTRLVRELAALAEVTRGNALIGECHAEGGRPYDPIIQILMQAFQDGARQVDLPEPVLADLITLAPDLQSIYPSVRPNPHLDQQSEQLRVYENVAKLCATYSARTPLLWVIDDAHWADSGTLNLIRHLARVAHRLPLLLVLTYREVELKEARPLSQLLVDLNHERLDIRLKLTRLSQEQTRALLKGMFNEDISTEFLKEIYRETEGNPFFIEEVIKTLIEEGKVYRQDGRWQRVSLEEIHVPQSVRMTIEARLEKLPESVQDILRLAAVIGRDFDFETLQKICNCSEDILIDTLESAERAQLISELHSHSKISFAFAHALIPSTLRETMSSLRLRRLHRQVAAAIQALRPEDYELLAYHFAQGGDETNARLFYTQAGTRSASRFAWSDAESYYRNALELTDDPGERANLLRHLADVLTNLARYDAAIQTFRSSAQIYLSLKDFNAIAAIYARASWAAWHSGRAALGLELALEGLKITEGQPPSLDIVQLMSEAAREFYFNEMPEESQQIGEKALEIATRLNFEGLQIALLATLALLPGLTISESIAKLRQAEQLANQLINHPNVESTNSAISRAYNNLVDILTEDGQYQAALAINERFLGFNHGTGMAEAWGWVSRGSIMVQLGRLKEARESLSQARVAMEKLENTGQVGTLVKCVEADLSFVTGDVDQATSILEELMETLRHEKDTQMMLNVSQFLAIVYTDMGRLEEALAIIEEVLPMIERGAVSGRSRAVIYDLLAVIYRRQGDAQKAHHALQQAVDASGPQPGQLLQVDRAVSEAMVAEIEGQWDIALEHYLQALELDRRLGRLWYRARIEGWMGNVCIRRNHKGDIEEARNHFKHSADIYQKIGATKYYQQAMLNLRSLDKA